MGFDCLFCRLYILLCILSINAFGHFGLGKCKLVTLRCRFHANNAGLGDLTMGILHFWPLGFLANSGIIWFLIVLFCRLYIFCAFFPAMPLDILALENVSWWYWGPGSTAQNAGFEDLTKRILHFWPLGSPRISGVIWVLIAFFAGCTFFCAFFPAMPLGILVLENVSWWNSCRFWRPYYRDLTFWPPRIP